MLQSPVKKLLAPLVDFNSASGSSSDFRVPGCRGSDIHDKRLFGGPKLPAKVIKLIVPFGPGGPTDLAAGWRLKSFKPASGKV